MATALASLVSGKPSRADVAMTGELTISGLVLPIGGLKEKILAARRANFHCVIVPRQNESNLSELPQEVRSSMEFVLADRIEDVLATAIPGLIAGPTTTTVPLPDPARGLPGTSPPLQA